MQAQITPSVPETQIYGKTENFSYNCEKPHRNFKNPKAIIQAAVTLPLYLQSFTEVDHTVTVAPQSGCEPKGVLLTAGAAPGNSAVLLPQALACALALLCFPGATM